jgi:CTP synthase
MVEIKDHPFFIATQFHPEFKSRPNRAHPLFKGVIEAAIKRSGRPFKVEAQDAKNGHSNGTGAEHSVADLEPAEVE